MAKKALGKGLGALIGGSASGGGAGVPSPASAAPAPGERVEEVATGMVVPSPLQPRKEFSLPQLSELVASIREHGIIQPLIVRRVGGKLELIAGERRWRAAQELGLDEVPVIVRSASDQDVLELALIENLQREDLNPIEEAQAYSRLRKEFGLRQEDIAERVGKNRATVANAIRLLDLGAEVQKLLAGGEISVGHAKVLLGVKEKKVQLEAAREVSAKGLTVRATEKLVAGILAPQGAAKKKAAGNLDPAVAAALKEVEGRLRDHFSSHIAIHHGEKRGRITIDYYGNDDLNRVLGLLGLDGEVL